jgi:DNA polymerase-3 subunit beta
VKSALQITAQDLDFGGEAKETIPCTFTSDALEIGFNSAYLIDILSHLESEQVTFRFSTPTRAGIVAPVGSDSDTVLMLVMPVRLNT